MLLSSSGRGGQQLTIRGLALPCGVPLTLTAAALSGAGSAAPLLCCGYCSGRGATRSTRATADNNRSGGMAHTSALNLTVSPETNLWPAGSKSALEMRPSRMSDARSARGELPGGLLDRPCGSLR